MDLELAGKAAIVTGGSGGIGAAIARELAREGMRVVLVARRGEPLERTAALLARETGQHVYAVPADTGSSSAVREMVERATSLLGNVDVLVNCAARPGGQVPNPNLADTPDDLVWDELNVKVMGYLRCAREVAPQMVRRGWGRIINIGGLAARQAGSNIGSMRNAALVAMAKNLALELGPKGVNVTVVHPGFTRTPDTTARFASDSERLGIAVEEVERRIAESTSIGRIVDASEVAYIVAFLASPKSVAINGDVIAAGGGAGHAIYY